MAYETIRVGIAGSGFIAEGLARNLANPAQADLELGSVLTRRPVDDITGQLAKGAVSRTLDEFVRDIDCVVECSGDPVHGTEVASYALECGLPVVTMDSELQVTTGSWLASRGGVFSEAEGDQPGSLAGLRKDVLAMGITPLVYGNVKGFLNHSPTPEEMSFWAEKQGISKEQVTSFTDGTKVQIEQALVANGLGAAILRRGLYGPEAENLEEGCLELGRQAVEYGGAISDYLLSRTIAPGVFITGMIQPSEADYFRYYKMGDGPFVNLLRPFHLCHAEIPKTIREAVREGKVLLNNGVSPTVNVVAVVKRDLPAETPITKAIGSFEFRGEAEDFDDNPDAVPIGLLQRATLTRPVEAGQTIAYQDVEIPPSLARTACLELREVRQKTKTQPLPG